MDEYALAKARLFEMLGEPTSKTWPRLGVVNADDPVAPASCASTVRSPCDRTASSARPTCWHVTCTSTRAARHLRWSRREEMRG